MHKLAVHIATLAVLCAALSGCEKLMRDMYNQPKYKPLAGSALWPDGRASRPLITGTLPHSTGSLAGTSSGRLGAAMPPLPVATFPLDESGQPKADVRTGPQQVPNPYPITAQLLHRGRERFDIYCSPCHSPVGDGDGRVVRRGFPAPPSYHSERLRNAPDSHFYAVITNGYGAMYSYASRVPPADRWAIVAYIRALQLSQHAGLDDVPPPQRARLEASR
jgi:mono/diheme cytochrome c family protein